MKEMVDMGIVPYSHYSCLVTNIVVYNKNILEMEKQMLKF